MTATLILAFVHKWWKGLLGAAIIIAALVAHHHFVAKRTATATAAGKAAAMADYQKAYDAAVKDRDAKIAALNVQLADANAKIEQADKDRASAEAPIKQRIEHDIAATPACAVAPDTIADLNALKAAR